MLHAVAGAPSAPVRQRLVETRDDFRAGIRVTADLLRTMAASGPVLPSRAHVTALLGRLHVRGLMMMHDWIQEAIESLDEVGDGDRAAFAVAEWTRLADTIDQVAASWDDSSARSDDELRRTSLASAETRRASFNPYS